VEGCDDEYLDDVSDGLRVYPYEETGDSHGHGDEPQRLPGAPEFVVFSNTFLRCLEMVDMLR